MSAAGVDHVWADLFTRHPELACARAAVVMAFEELRDVLAEGGRVLVCGNGGSAADSEHIAGELAKSCALPRPLGPELVARLRAAGDDGYLAATLQAGFAVQP